LGDRVCFRSMACFVALRRYLSELGSSPAWSTANPTEHVRLRGTSVGLTAVVPAAVALMPPATARPLAFPRPPLRRSNVGLGKYSWVCHGPGDRARRVAMVCAPAAASAVRIKAGRDFEPVFLMMAAR